MSCNYYCYDNPAALYRPLANAFWFEPHFEVRAADCFPMLRIAPGCS